jgi:tyrosine-protein phosphatase YwqE
MGLFGRRLSLKDSGFFEGFTDWHSHILPGVDDGVQTLDESLEILRLYETLGVKSVWLTPHVMEDVPNATAFLKERFAELQTAYTGPVELHLAAENMLDNLLAERLEQGDVLPLGEGGDHLLVETSYFNPPMGLHSVLERIKARGYHPVLAHPERYAFMGTAEYRRLKELGVKFQLNLFSLTGAYGSDAAGKALVLLKSGFYDLIGSDTHRLAFLADTLVRKTLKPSVLHRLKENVSTHLLG